jgi:tetratricopeptide (TPR) repeat protein
MVWQTKRRPWLLFGWLWFLGTLVPVIGLVSLNGFSMADRYMYVPAIGLFVMLAWSLKDLVQRWRHASPGVTAATVAAMAGCVTVASLQLRYWQNTETLFRHAVAVTPPNAMAEYFLGKAQITNHQIPEGLEHLETAVRIEPAFVAPHAIMAETLASEGRIREAMDQYRFALRCDPDSPIFLNNLAWLLATADDPSLRNGVEAVQLAGRGCDLTHHHKPYYIGTLAAAYAEAGRYEDAVRTAEQARALAITSGERDLAERTGKLLELYRAGRPYHENPGTK